jgi:DHA1 family bicyclomycin/chloramphenicol resistance-like MFS transporter
LSDKYGRRPILLSGLLIYVISSITCSLSWDIYVLIFSRICQAIGGSASSAVATAMVKDLYIGRKRESVLAVVQSMVIISPTIAPLIGAILLSYLSWRALFLALAFIGFISMVGAFLLEETIPRRYSGTVLQSLRQLGVALKSPGFTSLLIVFSCASIPFLAFIAASSYIYEGVFNLSPQLFSIYFAFNAMGMISGPLLYLKLSRHYRRESIILFCFLTLIIAGVFVTSFGTLGPTLFAITLFPATLMGSCMRPGGTYLMLEQQCENAGTASALINCFGLIFGSFGMMIVSLTNNNPVFIIGLLNVTIGIVCVCAWVFVQWKMTSKPIAI